MKRITVYFQFKTKKEWIAFGEKYRNKKEFIKYTPMIALKENIWSSFNDFVEYVYKNRKEPSHYISHILSLTTQSEKTLRNLSEFIKENHYENNYYLTNGKGKIMNLKFDTLFDWWWLKKIYERAAAYIKSPTTFTI